MCCAGLCASCTPLILSNTDKEVYSLIESRQKAALGATSDARLPAESGEDATGQSMYDFTPHPIDTGRVSANDEKSANNGAEDNSRTDKVNQQTPRDENTTRETNQDTSNAPPQPNDAPTPPSDAKPQGSENTAATTTPVFGIRESLAYAMRHAREFQNAKEDLYLAALDLTLERHLWTPQFVASISTEFADYGQVRDFDRAMSAVSNVAVTQRLPFGGEVAARVVNSLMRDLGVHTTSGESGNFILEANLPLLRGAGKVAYESRYQAERDLIYAVRDFEQFRRNFLVRVASDYFGLQGLKAGVRNAELSYESRKADYEKADTIQRLGQSQTVFDAPRALSSFRSAESSLASAKEQYASALDRFKIFIGMPVDAPLDVYSQDDDRESEALENLMPKLSEAEMIELALKYRLDRLNQLDAVDDAKRGIVVAKNRILPDLTIGGSAALDTDSTHLSSVEYNTERTTWRGQVTLETDDRKSERNAYRASLIALRRAERQYDQSQDEVRADVRRAFRRIELQNDLRKIQELSVQENELRSAAAKAQFDLGKATNQDRVDAENDLLDARNQLAAALAQYRISILEFRRDTGTLRVNDDGCWSIPDSVE